MIAKIGVDRLIGNQNLPRRRGDAEKSKDKTLKHRGTEEAEEKDILTSLHKTDG